MLSRKHALRSHGTVIYTVTLAIVLCTAIPNIQAQNNPTDTLSLNIKQAEKIFLGKNLELLAQHFNIEASKALAQQAKLWDDPILTTDQNIHANNKWLEHGTHPDGTPKGQYFIQLQQLIKTAGKRGKQINMANTNTNISEWQFQELMQHLKFQLRSDFYTAAQLFSLRQLYDQQALQLEKLSRGMNAQFTSGNIARKDLLRVQALQINLQQQMTDNAKQIADVQSELKTLLQITGDTYIKPKEDFLNVVVKPQLDITALIDSARLNNASYRLEQLQVQYQHQNLSYQKALAVPDITVGPSYDLNSNYAPHYIGLGISLPLPVLNSNKGNIKAARWQVKQQETHLSLADVRLQNDIRSAYKKYQYTWQLHSGLQQDFYTDYRKLQENITERFQQRQINLLEFIDYFNDYETVRTQQLRQQLELQLAREALNLQVGIIVFE